MKSISDIRLLIQQQQYNNITSDNIVASGEINDSLSQPYTYDILRGWSDALAYECNSEWGKFNLSIINYIDSKLISESEKIKLIESYSLEDAHWNWLGKHKQYYSSQYEWFFVRIDGKVQAACLVYHPEQAALTSAPIFYIEYLAVSPWNRPNPIQEQKFKGIGSILLKQVIDYATNTLGLSEGFSLHSLPKAKGFYTKIGMQAVQSKDKSSLAYFEMEKSQLIKFLGA